jgi:hypothetical protein
MTEMLALTSPLRTEESSGSQHCRRFFIQVRTVEILPATGKRGEASL